MHLALQCGLRGGCGRPERRWAGGREEQDPVRGAREAEEEREEHEGHSGRKEPTEPTRQFFAIFGIDYRGTMLV